jgi:hypothetical protein
VLIDSCHQWVWLCEFSMHATNEWLWIQHACLWHSLNWTPRVSDIYPCGLISSRSRWFWFLLHSKSVYLEADYSWNCRLNQLYNMVLTIARSKLLICLCYLRDMDPKL